MNLLSSLEQLQIKSKVRKIIYRAEISAPQMGISTMELLGKFAKELKDEKALSVAIEGIARKLRGGDKKEKAYKKYLTPDILFLIKDGAIKQISTESIFKGYVPYKELGEATEKSIRGKLYFPILLFVLAATAIYKSLGNFQKMAEGGTVKFGEQVTFLMDNFIWINLSFGIVVIYLLIIKPNKTPYIKNIFHKIDSMLALSTVKAMSEMTYASGEIRKSLMKQFTIPTPKRKKKYKSDVEALIALLKEENFVNSLQAAELKMSSERGKIKEGVETLLKEKEEEVRESQELVDQIISKVGMILLAVPLSIMVLTMIELLNNTGRATP